MSTTTTTHHDPGAEVDAWHAADCEHSSRQYEQDAASPSGWRVWCPGCQLGAELGAWTAETARGPQAYALACSRNGYATYDETIRRRLGRYALGARCDALELIDLLGLNCHEAADPDVIPPTTWAPGPVKSKSTRYVTELETAYRAAEAATKRRQVRNRETAAEWQQRLRLARERRDELAADAWAELAAEGWHVEPVRAGSADRVAAWRLRNRTAEQDAAAAKRSRRQLELRELAEQRDQARAAQVCAHCGASLANRRLGARFCSGAHKYAHRAAR